VRAPQRPLPAHHDRLGGLDEELGGGEAAGGGGDALKRAQRGGEAAVRVARLDVGVNQPPRRGEPGGVGGDRLLAQSGDVRAGGEPAAVVFEKHRELAGRVAQQVAQVRRRALAARSPRATPSSVRRAARRAAVVVAAQKAAAAAAYVSVSRTSSASRAFL
jgi:hypothetical protein